MCRYRSANNVFPDPAVDDGPLYKPIDVEPVKKGAPTVDKDKIGFYHPWPRI